MDISMQKFYLFSALSGFATALVIMIVGAPLLVVLGGFMVGSLGLPRWFVSFKRKRRVAAFLEEFPNALDIIVRSVRSGLPFNDAVRIIAAEAREPVRSEFRRIVEAQQVGLS